MYFSFKNKKITGVALIVPENERSFLDDMKMFNANEKRSLKLAQIMGYDKHRIAPDNITASDMVEYGFNKLFESGDLKKKDIDALVYITASPDYFLPPTSRILHGKLGLKQETYCIDITQGCCAFEEGLIQSFLLLDQPTINKIVLVTTDVLSHKVSKKDRNSYPLIGDAASITIIEKSDTENNIEAVILNDGTRADALKIPAGGFRMPCSAETAVLHADDSGHDENKSNVDERRNQHIDHLTERPGASPHANKIVRRSGVEIRHVGKQEHQQERYHEHGVGIAERPYEGLKRLHRGFYGICERSCLIGKQEAKYECKQECQDNADISAPHPEIITHG